ncbi:protein kinase [Tenggerimyces flavus]|uniref:non-specific serine/threonine protein kinase n=1 Tax=Tenggerimyces flavus TaxID=1708749 RepID=A0ABV7YK62_9ACTN
MAHERLNGRYDLEAIVGHGGMADVWRAHDRRLGRVVAVKVLRADLASDPTFPERLRREARSVARLKHPHIVDVYDAGVDTIDGAELPYLVMEYVTGDALSELLRDGQRLTSDRAMDIAATILDALDYSHRAGIVHRDVKPGNVMVTHEGLVKVMDFGIALAMSDSDTAANLTKTDQILGTARYLSPEQALGIPVDCRSDVYSTGCLLYELLTARPPFVGSALGVAYQHVQEEALSPRAIDPTVPELYAAIVLRALSKDPDERYQTAAQMRADIESALNNPPATKSPQAMELLEAVDTAGTVATVERGRRAPARTYAVTAAVAAAAAALALAGGAFLLVNWPELGSPQGTGTLPGESMPDQTGSPKPPLQPDKTGADTTPAAEAGAKVGARGGANDVDVQQPSTPEPSPPSDEPSPEPSRPSPETSPPAPTPAPTLAPTPREPKPVPTNPPPTPNDPDPGTPSPSPEPSEPEPEPDPEPSESSESTPSSAPTEKPLEPSPSVRR